MRACFVRFTLLLMLFLLTLSCDKKEILEPGMGSAIHELTDSIPYGRLGSGTIVFKRIGPGDTYEYFFVLDVEQQKSWPIKTEDEAFFPCVSPDGQQIVYTMRTNNVNRYDIHLMNINGSNNQNITQMEGDEYFPCWSPDGRFLYYSTDRNFIYKRKRSDGFKTAQQIYDFFNKSEMAPSSNFSVSGNNEIAFILPNSFNYVGLCLLNIDQQNVTLLVRQPDNRVFESPAFSPDGQKIAFLAVEQDTAFHAFEIMLYDLKSQNVSTLFSARVSGKQGPCELIKKNGVSLCWSPDGEKILFNKPDGNECAHLYLINADGSDLTAITSAEGVIDRSVSWGR